MTTARQTTALGFIAALATFAAGGAAAQTRELASGGELLDRVVALVDEGIVLRSELDQRMLAVVQNFRAQQQQLPAAQRGQLPRQSVLEEQVLEQLVVREIQLQRARQLGIQVGDDTLNQALGQVADNLGIPLNELPAAVEAEGINYAEYRESAREDIMLSQLEQRDVISRISVSPREMELCLERRAATQSERFDYNVSHILISVPSSATPEQLDEAEDRILEIRAEAEGGADFAQLALTHSDAQTALDGGSLGWRKGAELPTLFGNVVVGLEPGEISEPIQTGSGFHIVRLNDMRGAEPVMVDQLQVRHILLAPNEILDDDATRQKITGIRQRILGGDDFGTLAIANSEDAISASDGGDLGWVQPDEFVPEFAAKLRELEVGELSEPFRTRFGWHILEITDRRAHNATADVQRQECQREIRAGKAEEEREIWLRRLRDQAYVDLRL